MGYRFFGIGFSGSNRKTHNRITANPQPATVWVFLIP